MTLYRITKYQNCIEALKYERVTAKFAVRANGLRDSLKASYDSLHATREEAVEAKRAQLTGDLERATEARNRWEAKLIEFNKQENS